MLILGTGTGPHGYKRCSYSCSSSWDLLLLSDFQFSNSQPITIKRCTQTSGNILNSLTVSDFQLKSYLINK